MNIFILYTKQQFLMTSMVATMSCPGPFQTAGALDPTLIQPRHYNIPGYLSYLLVSAITHFGLPLEGL